MYPLSEFNENPFFQAKKTVAPKLSYLTPFLDQAGQKWRLDDQCDRQPGLRVKFFGAGFASEEETGTEQQEFSVFRSGGSRDFRAGRGVYQGQ